MKQYCRYCGYLVTGNGIYCSKNEKIISEATAKSQNRYSSFAYNPVDAFMENEKGYHPQQQKKPKKIQCDGQMSLF